MSWELVVLGEHTKKIGSGSTPKGGNSVYVDSGAAFIRSKNVRNLSFDRNDLAHISDKNADYLKGVEVKENDVLLNITGDSVARCCLVPNDVLPARVSQHVSIIRPDASIDSKYLAYYLVSPSMQNLMLGLAEGSGATRNALTKEDISEFKIPLPPLPIQRRIADILSAYDDLIENNQRQIKLLEEAAMRLYREWFVFMRFPGHESVRIEDGVPEGWKVIELSEAISFNPKYELKENDCNIFVPMQALNESCMILDDNKLESTNSKSGTKFRYGDTLLARITPSLENGKTAFVSILGPDEIGVGSTEFIVMRSKLLNPYLVYCIARSEWFRGIAIESMIGSTGRQRVQSEILERVSFHLPPDQILLDFEKNVEPMFMRITRLSKQKHNLQKARDALLPRLMNGGEGLKLEGGAV